MENGNIRKILAMVTCLAMSLPQSIFADGGKFFEISSDGNPVATKAYTPNDVLTPAQQPVVNSLGNDSPLSLPVNNSSGEVPTLTKNESFAVLVRVDELVNMTLDSMMSQINIFNKRTGKAPQTLIDEIKIFQEAKIVLINFFKANAGSPGLTESAYHDTSSSDSNVTALNTLRQVDEILGGEARDAVDNENLSSTPTERLIWRFMRYVMLILQAVRKYVEEGSSPEMRQFLLTAEPDLTEFRQITSTKAKLFPLKGQLPAQAWQEFFFNKDLNGKDVFAWMREALFGLSLYFEGSALLELSSSLNPLIRRYALTLGQVPDDHAESSKAKEISTPAMAAEGLLRNNKKITQMFAALGSLGGDLHAAASLLTDEDARRGLSLLIEALAAAGQTPGLSRSEAEKLATANFVIMNFLKSESSSARRDGSAVSDLIAEIEKILGSGSSIRDVLAKSSLGRPEELIPELARCIASSVQTAHQNLEDGSLPEARRFSEVESTLVQKRNLVLSGEPDRENGSSFRVVDAVILSRENARASALLDPSHQLHPFIRWLLYGRHLTQVRAEGYLAEQSKVKEIYLRAKAGEGLIRYKGKIMESFLPLPGDENGGTFELIRRV